jgi:hypothetical protein
MPPKSLTPNASSVTPPPPELAAPDEIAVWLANSAPLLARLLYSPKAENPPNNSV